MTQQDRVLAALTRAGARGITRVDFQAPDVIDGGEPILNIPARILELKNDGFRITEDGRRNRCKVYVLCARGSAADQGTMGASLPGAAASPEPSGDALVLFPADTNAASHWKAA